MPNRAPMRQRRYYLTGRFWHFSACFPRSNCSCVCDRRDSDYVCAAATTSPATPAAPARNAAGLFRASRRLLSDSPPPVQFDGCRIANRVLRDGDAVVAELLGGLATARKTPVKWYRYHSTGVSE